MPLANLPFLDESEPFLDESETAVIDPDSVQRIIDSLDQAHVPRGFKFGSTTAKIKPSGKPDLCLVVADRPVTAAGIYTQNQIVAAPVVICRDLTPMNDFRAVVTCSGNANACTGQRGMDDAKRMADVTASAVGCDRTQVLVMSTGIIGHPLPMEKIEPSIESVAANLSADHAALLGVAEAIRTTDQFSKLAHRTVELTGGPVRIFATAKGAGMIEPNMATMLSMVLTDAPLDAATAQAILKRAADQSLNRISVDGHTSTNDTLLLLASGEGPSLSGDDADKFCAALADALIELGKMIVADGEGAKHYMDLSIRGATDDAAAEKMARSIAASPLVKTAITGGDPNWGRIVSAAGYAGVELNAATTSLTIFDVVIYRDGVPQDFDAKSLSRRMKATQQIDLELTVGTGPGNTRFWASDLTKAYVDFNSEYTT